MIGQFAGRFFDPARPLAFMHVPKTSGTALVNELRQSLAPLRALSGFDELHFGSFTAFDTIRSDLRRAIFRDAAAMPPDADFITGHFAVSTLRLAYPNAQFATVLREPLSRTLSHWLFWRQTADAHLPLWGGWAQLVSRAKLPLVDFLDSRDLACQFDNIAVRMLLAPHPLIPQGDFIPATHDAALLAEAFTRLRQFAFVDLMENPELITNLSAWVGRALPYPVVNRTSLAQAGAAPLHNEFTFAALERLESHSRLDTALWDALAEERVTGIRPAALRRQTQWCNIARYASLTTSVRPPAPQPQAPVVRIGKLEFKP